MSTRYTNNKPDCWIFDLDGTLANHKGNRSPYDESRVLTDKVIDPVAIVLRALSKDYKILFVSGRTEGCRADTVKWIQTHIGLQAPDLFMRQIDDVRGDAIIKKEIYDAHIIPFFNIIGVFDDRLRVIRMLYDNNIFCFNVNQGNLEY